MSSEDTVNRDEGFSCSKVERRGQFPRLFRSKSPAVRDGNQVGRRVLAQMDPSREQHKALRAAITSVHLIKESGAHLSVSALRAALKTKKQPKQECDPSQN